MISVSSLVVFNLNVFCCCLYLAVVIEQRRPDTESFISEWTSLESEAQRRDRL